MAASPTPAAPTTQPSTAGTVAPVPSTPTVISSSNLAGSFANNSTKLAQQTTPIAAPAPQGPAPDQGATGTPSAPTSSQPTKQISQTGDNSDASTMSTGNPLYDGLLADEQKQADQLNEQAQNQKDAFNTLFAGTLSKYDDQSAQGIQDIKDQYAGLTDAQTRLNRINTSRAMAYGLSAGGMAAAPEELTAAISNTEQEGITKLNALAQKRDDAVNKAKQAQETGDANLLEKQTAEIAKIDADTRSAISGLRADVNQRVTLINDAVRTATAQQKANSANVAAAGAAQFGAKYAAAADDNARDQIIKQILSQTGANYSDVFKALTGYVANAQKVTAARTTENSKKITQAINQLKLKNAPTATRLANEKSQLQIQKDKKALAKGGSASTPKPKTDGTYSYTADDVSTYSDFLERGGKSPDGTAYRGRGSDGYVDPGAYTAAYNDWISNGGTPAGFAKNFPVEKNVNPNSYASLPTVLQPAADAKYNAKS